MENKKCISYGLEHEAGVIISRCYQCGKCTAGCVLAEEMDFPPSFLVRLLQTRTPENDNRVLGSNAIWICLNCGNCIARCPKEIDIPKIMDYLREQSRHRNCINKQSRPVVAFHSAFLQSVRYTGRLVPGMLKKGKLNLLPECIETRQKIKKIFSKTIDKKEK